MKNNLLFLLLLTSSAIAQDDLVQPCTSNDKIPFQKLIESQVQKPFSEKFKLITSNPAAQGLKNLVGLRKSFAKYYNTDLYRPSAVTTAKQAYQSLSLVHATHSEKAFYSILSSGFLYSKDELVRRKILTWESYDGPTMTNPYYDGAIGEQDVVYLALQPNEKEGMYAFGNFTFVFDKETVFDRSYMTLNSFTMGAPIDFKAFPSDGTRGCNRKAFEKMIQTYPSVLFSGKKQYFELLVWSAIQLEINQSLDHKSTSSTAQKLLKDYNDEYNVRANVSNRNQTEFIEPVMPKMDAFCEWFEKLHQDPSGCRNKTYSGQQVLNFLTGLANLQDPELIRAYAYFPQQKNDPIPHLIRNTHWFWEVKVPIELSLDHVQEIILPLVDVYYLNDVLKKETWDHSGYETAIREFAAKKGWKVDSKLLPATDSGAQKISYRFIKN